MRKAVVGFTLFLLAAPLLADKKLDDRMMHATSILQEIRGPLEEDAPGVLENAYAVAIFPEFVQVGLFGGVKHGSGVLATRLESGDWSKPAFVRITSGSFGLQFGVSMSQLLIVFKDPKAVEAISGGQFAIGADAGYAAGELGGSASAGTDNKLENRTVAMARSKGLFAGVALEGGVLRIEKDSNVEFYNDAIGLDGRTLLEDEEVELPPVAQHFLIVLGESVPPLAAETAPISGDSKADTASADAFPDPGSPASRAVANAHGPANPGGASAGSWVTPHGAELPSGNAALAPSGGNSATAPQPITAETAGAANWVSPEDAPPAQGDASWGQEPSGGSGLGRKIAGKATKAVWDGAKELALESIRNQPEAQGAKVAATVGAELFDGDEGGSRPQAPPSEPPYPPVATAANNGEWVEPVEARASLANPAPQTGAPGYQLAATTPDSLPAIASIGNTDFTGPPAPSEWPQEWRDFEQLGGVCEPGF